MKSYKVFNIFFNLNYSLMRFCLINTGGGETCPSFHVRIYKHKW